jgi:hypothetical protein
MKKVEILLVILGLLLFSINSNAQTNKSGLDALKAIVGDVKLKVDTASPAEDSLTIKIRVLRSERGTVNWDNLIKLSLEDKQSKDTLRPAEYYQRLLDACQNGYPHRLIENVIVNLYRQCFTEKEVDQLIELYKTPLGKKMFFDFLLITTTSAPAIQKIVDVTADKIQADMKSKGKMK